ncbi:aldo/keto reductase [Neisseria perflava]|uniref:aldo/keto reductase n=1 Tax=Neisseria perflava TaxID=33053 RepID=UPI00209F004A|nr:aldo/keto reductase [Neisseria perflava]MCP1660449.1 aryl-alcohol dehydrogenase-like predicted oxidoreductase [Neisseria perflava]MCP1772131.1 aryl-alcohol dehydrogenase-like predicted oxidoreductase [Neisseria perflava]
MNRIINNTPVYPIGLGCMNLSHAYGTPPSESDAQALLHRAIDLGYNFFDTATLYGFGTNETLVGKTLKPFRNQIFLASKCGMGGVNGKRVIDGRPETILRQADESLQRLQTDVIDLYYLHRWDKNVPIEESVGALSRLVEQGKIRAVGLSEVSADTLSRAHAVHPITALQTEYSLWTRNPEIAVLQKTREIGAALVAFSPVARGFLGDVRDPSALEDKDIRRPMPRFSAENYPANLQLRDRLQILADQAGCTAAQLGLAWLLAQQDNIIPIPGTTSIHHLEDNYAAASLNIAPEILQQAGELINQSSVKGARYPTATQTEIDTEEF